MNDYTKPPKMNTTKQLITILIILILFALFAAWALRV
jgi:hypothetical protein